MMKFINKKKDLHRIKKDVEIIEFTLESFGLLVKIKEVGFLREDNQTYFDAIPEEATKLRSVSNLREDLAFRLKIRLEDFLVKLNHEEGSVRFLLPYNRYIKNE